jgi:hypothetical protein
VQAELRRQAHTGAFSLAVRLTGVTRLSCGFQHTSCARSRGGTGVVEPAALSQTIFQTLLYTIRDAGFAA